MRWSTTIVLVAVPAVAWAQAPAPSGSAAPICMPAPDPGPHLGILSQMVQVAVEITPEHLQDTPAMPSDVPRMLRQAADGIICDKASTTTWPTQQECDAISTMCTAGRPVSECKAAWDARQACRAKVAAGDPRVRADQLAAKARSEAERIESAIAAELSCRASASCMDHRYGDPVCGQLQRRRELLASIAQEKANPAGVVDLVRLHDLGEGVQDADAEIKAGKASYLAARHKAFAEALCK